jgi:hypothetical protein
MVSASGVRTYLMFQAANNAGGITDSFGCRTRVFESGHRFSCAAKIDIRMRIKK